MHLTVVDLVDEVVAKFRYQFISPAGSTKATVALELEVFAPKDARRVTQKWLELSKPSALLRAAKAWRCGLEKAGPRG